MKFSCILFIAFSVFLFSCSKGKYGDLPLDKRFWTPEDYDKVVFTLRFSIDEDEKLPTFDDPETSGIVQKLVDEENYKVVLDDDQLGVKYRNEIAEKYFRQWKDMNKIYTQLDRQDKFLYPLEYVECFKFGLGLQLRYFGLGNQAIRENAVDPDSKDLKSTLDRNVRTMISNYNIYLELIKREDSFSEEALVSYGNGLEKYFTLLVTEYPDQNYKGTINKLKAIKKNFSNTEILQAIDKIDFLIESNNPSAF